MRIKLGNLSIIVSIPLCCVMTAIILLDSSQTVMLGCFSALMHESGHLFFMWHFNSFPKEIKISLFDIAIIDHKKFNRPLHQELLITLGGVMINLIFGSVCFVLYLIFKYNFLIVLSGTNILLLIYNLLPIDTLDGGQALYLILSSKLSEKATERTMLILSLVILFPCTVLGFLLLLQSKYNFTLLLTSLYLIAVILLKKTKIH